MATPESLEPTPTVRVCFIAGRYLVFEAEAAALLRRQENTNGTLVGTIPQQPTQNIFLGLPIELRPEEAGHLVRNGSAHVVDATLAHRDIFRDSGNAYKIKASRRAYVDALRASKRVAHHALGAMMTKKQQRGIKQVNCAGESSWNSTISQDFRAFEGKIDAWNPTTNGLLAETSLAVTLSTSSTLLPVRPQPTPDSRTQASALCDHMHSAGYYMTPGLRFGARYSVYPGDPLRFHAHFMANEYGWDEDIPILDLVGGGRLATAVKKSFLIGGQGQSSASSHGPVRTYSIEWAAM